MCDSQPCAKDVAQAIGDTSTRWEALTEVIDLSDQSFDPECVRTLVNSLTGELSDDPSGRLVWKALISLAELYPLTVTDMLETVVSVTPPNDRRAAGFLGQVIYSLQEADLKVADKVGRAYAQALKQADRDEARIAAARLHARYGTRRDVEALEEMADYEVGAAATEAERALQRLIGDAIHRLQSGTETADLNSEVRIVQGVAYTEPERLADYTDELLDILSTEHADVAAISLGELIQCGREVGGQTAEQLVDAVRIDPSHPVEDTEPLREAEGALRALARGDELQRCLNDVVSNAGQWLDSDDVDLHEHGLAQLRLVARHAPDAIKSYLDQISELADGESEEGSLAAEVMWQYASSQSDDRLAFIEQMLDERNGHSAVGYLASTGDSLQYRRIGETSYSEFPVEEPIERALQNIAEVAETNQTRPVVWPAYDPQTVVLVALELALCHLKDGSNIALFSPGGQNHWGNKGELRSELERYGVVENRQPIPLPNVVPHAYVSDGEVANKSDGEADTSIVLTKRLEELREIDAPDAIVLNLTSRTKESYEEEINELVEEFDSSAFVPVYSQYTKHEFDERRVPRYGPPREVADADVLPGVAPLEAATERDGVGEHENPRDFTTWFDRDTDPQELRIVGVADRGLMNYLETGYDASAELREYDENRAAGLVFSKQLIFERLPVPTGKYDDWVRSQPDGYFTARTIKSLIRRLEERANDLIGRAGVAQSILHTAEALERAYDHVREESPLYDELTSRLQQSLDDGYRVVVFLPKSTWRRAVESILVDTGVVTAEEVDSGRVQFVDPDSARSLNPCDRLFVVGPQRPQYAGFYLHPAVDETVVITYLRQWDWMIKRDTSRFVELQNDASPGIDYEPYQEPTIVTEMTDELAESLETAEKRTPTEPDPEEPPTASSSGAGENQTATANSRRDLADMFDQAREVDYSSSGSDRYDDYDRREFSIETVGGETATRRDRVLRKRENPSANEPRYHWLSPNDLRAGDEIVLFDEDEMQRRWQAWLEDVYSDELGGTTTVEDLTLWYESLTEILDDVMEAEGVDDPQHTQVRGQVIRQTSDIDREQLTRWNWFESVAKADSPLELAQDSSLTIGPRRPADIAAVGEAFDVSKLKDNAPRIEGSMGQIRGTNSREGHRFREELKEKMNSLDNDDLTQHATVHEVTDVSEV